MPRRQRVQLDDVPLHIVQRGRNREPCSAYRHLFRYHLDEEMVGELRLAVNQDQPLANERFYETIEHACAASRGATARAAALE